MFIWNLPYKLPACYGVRHTPIGVCLPFSVTRTVRERPHTVLITANPSKVPFICVVGTTFYVSAISIAKWWHRWY